MLQFFALHESHNTEVNDTRSHKRHCTLVFFFQKKKKDKNITSFFISVNIYHENYTE